MSGEQTQSSTLIDTLRILRMSRGKGQVRRMFFIATFTVLLIFLLGSVRGTRKRLKQNITSLQTHNRFLYSGNICLPRVALTFDDGPSPDFTPQILAVLERYGVKATFFCIGRHVACYPDLVKQAYDDGHVIGNHSWSHPNLALLPGSEILSQLRRTSEAIGHVIGVQPTFFRPPYGAFRSQVLAQADLLGITTVIWNVRATDWAKPGIDVISERVIERTGNGAIILLHDGGGDRRETVAALPAIIEGLQGRGFTFVTLGQMLDDLGSASKEVGGPEGLVWWDLLVQFAQKLRLGV